MRYKADVNLEADQWVTDNSLQLHWQLLPHDDLDLDRPQLYFDVRYSMSRAFHVREGHGSSVSKTYLERLATRRPLARMTFTVFGLSACSIVIHRPQGVRVGDVLEHIHELLQAPLSPSERETGRAARCLPHYEERVRQERLLDDSYVDVGMRRLDLLEGRFIFDGCQWRPPRERYPDGSWTLMFSSPVWKSHKVTD
ncbi:hypothetical protein PENSPDRAFT_646500 [Peniophora sp. CONT]|nr:hypothetical protein PENSPDRAFT_646500 [Peniophora sp. CONT]